MQITIHTRFGPITGRQESHHQAFLGICYAQPPVGKLRFQPPQLNEHCEGTLDATRFGPIAPQNHPDTPPLQLEESESCLVLNIYTPSADSASRPVMVYIHGGAFVIDSGSRPRTYGGNLAECGDVVVVTIDYRMGAFGFLYAEGVPLNLGLLDQICALRWIQSNIADFGGDPGNVTIFGESAGAMSVARLLVMPAAAGLFHKAILESGAFTLGNPIQSLRSAQSCARKFFKALKIQPGDLQALQSVPYEKIMNAQRKVMGPNPMSGDLPFWPVQDGQQIPMDVYNALRHGPAKDIPILIGYNAEEIPLFGGMIHSRIQQWLAIGSIKKMLNKMGLTETHIQRLLAVYRKTLPPAQVARKAEYNHLISDAMFRIPAILLAEAHQKGHAKTYFYCFAHPSPKLQVASHVLELYFVFGTLASPDISDRIRVACTQGEVNLATQMMRAWSSFARNGDPSHAGMPTWPAYEEERRATMYFEIPPKVVEKPLEEIRIEWEWVVRNG